MRTLRARHFKTSHFENINLTMWRMLILHFEKSVFGVVSWSGRVSISLVIDGSDRVWSEG